MAAVPVELAHIITPASGQLVASPAYQPAADALARSLLTLGYGVLQLDPQTAAPLLTATAELSTYWAKPEAARAALAPLQPADDVGHRLLEGDREVLEHRSGPWLREDKPLPALEAVSGSGGLVLLLGSAPRLATGRYTTAAETCDWTGN